MISSWISILSDSDTFSGIKKKRNNLVFASLLMRCLPVWISSSDGRAGMRAVMVSAMYSPHHRLAVFATAGHTPSIAQLYNNLKRNTVTPLDTECYIFASCRTQYNLVFFFSLSAALLTV
jgi:hypothetical protein